MASRIGNLVLILVLIYMVSPVIFRYSTFIQRSLLFMNHINSQYGVNLSHPEQVGIKCSRVLRLRHRNQFAIIGDNKEQMIELGAWHILPQSSLSNCETNHENNRTYIDEKLAFSDSRPIILYVHGNGGNRAGDHRNRLYKRLAYEFDFHIVTFDYRGYGDSTYETPSAYGLTSDTAYAYKWLLSQPNVHESRVFVWGHSLGTAIAMSMVAGLSDDHKPSKIVLEAPFDTLANAIANHPFSYPFRFIPYFEFFFVDPIKGSLELNFNSLEKVGRIKDTPILIIHAEDDGIIPFKLGENLYKHAVEKLGNMNIHFISISGSFGLGHKNICTHNETMEKIERFLVNEHK